MITMHALSTRFENQSLADPLFTAEDGITIGKIRHNSEPKLPRAHNTGVREKKVKVIAFHEGQSVLCSNCAELGDWCDDGVNPPLKRQCRSQSIPSDSELQSEWLQSQTARRLHRPLPIRPSSGGSRPKSHHGYLSTSKNGLYDFHTPPESPVPRPSSASSGFCDSPITSFSNLSKQRSESLQSLPSGGIGATLASKSMPSVMGLAASQPSSPLRHQLPRCHSQPCVLHERRSATKRRRDDTHFRPCLNFSKMTETAYTSCASSGLTRSSPMSVKSSHHSVFSNTFHERILQTIASSPHDSFLSCSPNAVAAPPAPSLKETDSGCSSSSEDDHICDKVDSETSKDNRCTNTEVQPRRTEPHDEVAACDCEYVDALDTMFPMDSELDLDLIEND